MADRGGGAIGGVDDLAAHRHPDMRMRLRGTGGRAQERGGQDQRSRASK